MLCLYSGGLFSCDLLFLLSEVLSPKDLPIKASLQTWRYFNLGNQAALQRMLPDCEHAQRSSVGPLNNMKMMSRNISRPLCLGYLDFSIGSQADAMHSCILKNFPPP